MMSDYYSLLQIIAYDFNLQIQKSKDCFHEHISFGEE